MHPHRIDAAVVDVGLPDREGYEVVAALRSLQPHARCVIVTGADAGDGAERARQLGAQFRSKPLDLEELAALLEPGA